MIVLKILLYLLLVVAAIVLFVLIIPMGGEYSYIDGKLRYKVKLWFINIMDSEGGGLYRRWKKRKSDKKDKPQKLKKSKLIKNKKSKKKKKQREQYEWEKELDNIPVNDPEAEAAVEHAENVAETSEDTTDNAAENVKDDAASDKAEKTSDDAEKTPSDEEDGDIYDEDDDDNDSSSISDKIEKIIGLWESAQRPALKILHGVRIYDFYIDFIIADDDAYKCALKYGKYSAAVFNGLAFFSAIFTIRFKTVDVRPQFGVSKGRWDTSAKFSFRLGTLVIAGAWLLITYLFRTFLPEKIRKRKMEKSAARQK